MLPPRFASFAPTIVLVLVASSPARAGNAATPAPAPAPPAADSSDHQHVVNTQAILTGPRWYFGSTPRGHLTSARGDAVTIVLGRDRFTADGTSALSLEAHLSSAIGGGGAIARAGVSLGLKARTESRIELGIALVIANHFDPDHVRDVNVAPGALAQLSYDLDDAPPFSTRVLLRAQLDRPSDRTATLDTFVGIGTRWP